MLDPHMLRDFENYLVTRGGGYLRNPIREPNVTCSVCTTPVDGYARCFSCRDHVVTHRHNLADAVAPLTYAVRGDQAAYMMRGYKAPRPIQEHVTMTSVLTWVGLHRHTACAGALLGTPVTHWATVPSLPPRAGTEVHPFHRIVTADPPAECEVTLVPVTGASAPRDVAYEHFTTTTTFAPRSHVLILDDTWAKGGHAQSVALTLRRAGADKISIMVAARWINPEFGTNERFVRDRLNIDYDPRICPWVGATCP